MIMKAGTIVKFRDVVDVGDENIRMMVLEDSDRERVLVEALVGMSINPTYQYNVADLKICDTTHSTMLQ